MLIKFSRREILAAFLGSAGRARRVRHERGAALCRRARSSARRTASAISCATGCRSSRGRRVGARGRRHRRRRRGGTGGGVAFVARGLRRLRRCSSSSRPPGGTSRSGEAHGVVPYPWGAHYLPAPSKENRALVALLDEMGVLEGADAEGRAGRRRTVPLPRPRGARLLPRAAGTKGSTCTRARAEEDARAARRLQRRGRRLGRVARRARAGARSPSPSAHCSDDAEATALDRVSMAEWMRARGLDSQRLRWLVDYACRDDYGADRRADERLGRALLLRLAHEAAGRGGAAAHHMARGQRPPRRAPVREGARARASRPRRRGHASPRRRGTAAAGVEVVAVGHDGRGAVGFRAERVIFAAPQFLTRYLMRPYREGGAPAHVARVRVRRVDGREPLPRRPPAPGARLPARVGQRALRKPLARLRRRHAPARPRPRPDRLHLLLPAHRRRPARRAHAPPLSRLATSGPTSRSPTSPARTRHARAHRAAST